MKKDTALWQYLTEELKGLILDGELLIENAQKVPSTVSDYSYLVFPFAKAYEGFCKKLFLDLGVIKEDEYYGDDIRIGRILSPRYRKEHSSIFKTLCLGSKKTSDLSERLWDVWKRGRNLVFHYFPHNFRHLNRDEALAIIQDILDVMEEAVGKCFVVSNLSHST